MKTLTQAKLHNKAVIVRVDVNAPVESDGTVHDDYRIRAIVPTLQLLMSQGCRIILCGHRGRPAGWDDAYTLRPIAERLAHILQFKFVETAGKVPAYPINHVIFFTGNIQLDKNRILLRQAPTKDIIFLENLRFYAGESENDPFFSRQLSELGDAYVNEAFAVSHHAASSLVGITQHLPSFAGLQLDREIKALNFVEKKARSPFIFMMGGIKISDKVATLEHVGKRADAILLGGGLANLFFLAKGYEVGASKVETEAVKIAYRIDKNFKDKIVLPVDVVVASKLHDKDTIRVCAPHEVKKREMILDIGPKSILLYAKKIKEAQTVVWNGPLGHFEVKPFDTATSALAKIVGAVSRGRAFGVVGGGETVDAVRHAGQEHYIDLVSTGGGAMLCYLAGEKLPGLEALK